MSNFVSNANQRKMKIHRTETEKGEQYLSVSCQKLAEASRNISGSTAFRLYLYLCSNADGYEFYYSPAHFAGIYGVSISSAREAIRQLEKQGYVRECGNNRIEFYDTPQATDEDFPTFEEEQRWLVKAKGTKCSYAEFYNHFKDMYPIDLINANWNALEVVK